MSQRWSRPGRWLATVAVALVATVGAPDAYAAQPPEALRTELFAVGLHGRFTKRAVEDAEPGVVTLSPAAWRVFKAAQRRTDHPLTFPDLRQGEKQFGNFYLHYVWPDQGYVAAAHAAVLAELGFDAHPRARATLGDFVAVSQARFEDQLVHLLELRGADLDEREVGMIVYALAIRVHSVQDVKHRFQARDTAADILSFEHFLRFPVQLGSDCVPRKWRRTKAIDDTRAFFASLHAVVAGRLGETAWSRLATALAGYAPVSPPRACELVPAIPADAGSSPPPPSERWCPTGDGATGAPATPSFTMEWMFPSWDWYGRDFATTCSAADSGLDRKVCKAAGL